MLIINLLQYPGCVCAMSTYNNGSIAGAKGENMVWGWGRVSTALGSSAAKSQGNIREFYIDWRVVTLNAMFAETVICSYLVIDKFFSIFVF